MSGYVDIEVRNYRCFEDSEPLRFRIQKGAIGLTGPNNAGKSSVLRFIYEMRQLWAYLTQLSSSDFGKHIFSTLSGNSMDLSFHDVKDNNEVFCHFNNRPLTISLIFNGLKTSKPHIQKIKIKINRDRKGTIEASDNNGNLIGGDSSFNRPARHARISPLDQEETSELITALTSSMYIGAFRNAINAGGGQYFDLNTGTQFIQIWREWQTGNNVEQRKAILSVTNDIQALFDLKGLTISSSSDGNNIIITADDETLRADELGAGLSQFIIILGNLAIKKPKLVLIDEPELNLHPLLQVKFLSMVESYAEYGVLFSTHSVGLARSAGDHIYSVLKQGTKSLIKPWGTDKGYLELAGELSYSAWPEMGAGKVLLCEGTTEIKAFQHFLRLLGKDKDVLPIPLGGSSMINGNTTHELRELKRLNVPISVIIDSEKTHAATQLSQDRKDFISNCEALEFKVHTLSRRAFENYLTEKAIKEVKGDNYQALSEYQLLGDISPAWSKSENWKIALKMDLDDISGNDLGAFLNSI